MADEDRNPYQQIADAQRTLRDLVTGAMLVAGSFDAIQDHMIGMGDLARALHQEQQLHLQTRKAYEHEFDIATARADEARELKKAIADHAKTCDGQMAATAARFDNEIEWLLANCEIRWLKPQGERPPLDYFINDRIGLVEAMAFNAPGEPRPIDVLPARGA